MYTMSSEAVKTNFGKCMLHFTYTEAHMHMYIYIYLKLNWFSIAQTLPLALHHIPEWCSLQPQWQSSYSPACLPSRGWHGCQGLWTPHPSPPACWQTPYSLREIHSQDVPTCTYTCTSIIGERESPHAKVAAYITLQTYKNPQFRALGGLAPLTNYA